MLTLLCVEAISKSRKQKQHHEIWAHTQKHEHRTVQLNIEYTDIDRLPDSLAFSLCQYIIYDEIIIVIVSFHFRHSYISFSCVAQFENV